MRDGGWQGYWLDAASTLRMSEDATIVLDPVNLSIIQQALEQGCKNFVGGNCTVSLMLIALSGLFQEDLIEYISAMTYQSASGGGAKHMRELLQQMQAISQKVRYLLNDPAASILEIDRKVSDCLFSEDFPSTYFTVPLAANLIPWIDTDLGNGQSLSLIHI